MSKFALCLGLLAATATGLYAQTSTYKTPVAVDCSPRDDDAIGIRFCSDLRDVIARSPRYRLTTLASNEAYYTIDVVTMPSQSTSAASVVFLMNARETKNDVSLKLLMTHSVWVTGMNKTASQAADVLADLDNHIESAKNSK